MKKFLKILAIIIVVLILLPLILLIVLHFVSSDISEVDDQDLMVVFETIPESQNAYFELVEAQDKQVNTYSSDEVIDYLKDDNTKVHLSYDSGGEIVEGFGDDEIEQLLDENEETLTLFEIASQKSAYQDPVFNDFGNLNYDSYWSGSKHGNVLGPGRIVLIEALYELKNGNDEEAFNKSLQLAKIGQMMIDSDGMLVQKLIGISMKALALENANYILTEGDFDSEKLDLYKATISDFSDSLEGVYSGYKVEYMVIKNTIDYVAEQDQGSLIDNIAIKHNFYFKSNKTKQMFIDHTRKLLNNESVDESQFTILAGIITENFIGKRMFLSFAQSNMNDKTEAADSEYEKLNNLLDLKLTEAAEEVEEIEDDLVPVKRT